MRSMTFFIALIALGGLAQASPSYHLATASFWEASIVPGTFTLLVMEP